MAEEEGEKRSRTPTKDEIIERAIQLYMKDHPEAYEHKLTPELHELSGEEGGYLERARDELMRGPSREIAEILRFLDDTRQSVEQAVARLRELGVTPQWPPPSPRELSLQQAELKSRIASLEREVKQALEEKRRLEAQIEAIRKAYEEARAELARRPRLETETVAVKQYIPTFIGADGKAYGPFYPGNIVVLLAEDAEKLIQRGLAERLSGRHADFEALREEANRLWDTYISAVVSGDVAGASEAGRRLREIRMRLKDLYRARSK